MTALWGLKCSWSDMQKTPAARLPASCTPLGGFALTGGEFVSRLNVMGVDDGRNQAEKALIDFCATRGVLHFDTAAFSTDQACLSQRFEVLRESRFGYRPFAYVCEIGTVLRTL